MKYEIFFHVIENTESDAKEWLRRVQSVLNNYTQELVTRDGRGKWCEGHVQLAKDQPEAPQPDPARVLQMGPRE